MKMKLKSFKQFLKESKVSQYEWFTFEIDEYIIYILFDRRESAIFEEANRRGTLGGQFSYKLDNQHAPVGQEHIHVYKNENQIFAMNIDGTAHDRSHGIRIPNKVAKGIKQKLPGFKLPANNFIESPPADIIELFREQILLSENKETDQ